MSCIRVHKSAYVGVCMQGFIISQKVNRQINIFVLDIIVKQINDILAINDDIYVEYNMLRGGCYYKRKDKVFTICSYQMLKRFCKENESRMYLTRVYGLAIGSFFYQKFSEKKIILGPSIANLIAKCSVVYITNTILFRISKEVSVSLIFHLYIDIFTVEHCTH